MHHRNAAHLYLLTVPTPAEVLVRAEQRLQGMVARRAPHDLVLRSFAAYERMHAEAVSVEDARDARDVAADDADLTAVLAATA